MLFKFVLLLFWLQHCLANGSHIVRPCDLGDYKCIGEKLSLNSDCKPKRGGRIESEYLVESFRFDTPYFNATYIDIDLIVRNQDRCYVSEFFFNTKTETAVLAIDCPYLDLESDRVFIQHRSCQEDSYYLYHIRAIYPLIRITINLMSRAHMDLCSAFVFTDVAALPRFHIDPKNKPTANYLSRDPKAMNIYERENFNARGPPLAYVFVDSLLCDYGCPLPK